jgi:membrane protein
MPDRREAAERGAFATSPAEFGWKAWRDILGRVWTNSGRHSIGFLASGVAFYGFLSFVPALALLVMVYGMVAEPTTLFARMVAIIRLVPAQSAELINEQLANLIRTAAVTKGLALVPAVVIALYGASGAASGMITSLNMVYEQEERRGIVRLFLVALGLVCATILLGILGLVAASALGLLQTMLGGLGPVADTLLRVLTWLLTTALVSAIIAAMYRYGPCRHRAKWRWLTLGSLAATLLWLLGSVLFGWYAGFADYGRTYGSLGAVVALLMWFFVSAYAVLLGAFVDAEAERQTARDSTTGPDRPLGRRGAVVADSSEAIDASKAAPQSET